MKLELRPTSCNRGQVSVYFEANHAEQYGGAMFVTDEPFLYCTRDQPTYICVLTREHCFFQPLDLPTATALFILENNTAVNACSTLYGGMVDSCNLYPVKDNSGEVFDTPLSETTTQVIN